MLRKLSTGKVLTSIVVICMFSCMMLLSSCTAVIHTPRPHRTHVVVERQVVIRNHDNGLHRGKIEKREKREKRGHRERD